MLVFRIGRGCLLLLGGGGCVADAPDTRAPAAAMEIFSEDTLALKAEVVVARDILHAYVKYGVLVDSMFAVAEQAPGSASAETRPPARSKALRDSLGTNADSKARGRVLLHLSKPSISGSVARVTVTVGFPDAREPGGRGYETVDYTLDRSSASWTIRTRVQLGIT